MKSERRADSERHPVDSTVGARGRSVGPRRWVQAVTGTVLVLSFVALTTDQVARTDWHQSADIDASSGPSGGRLSADDDGGSTKPFVDPTVADSDTGTTWTSWSTSTVLATTIVTTAEAPTTTSNVNGGNGSSSRPTLITSVVEPMTALATAASDRFENAAGGLVATSVYASPTTSAGTTTSSTGPTTTSGRPNKTTTTTTGSSSTTTTNTPQGTGPTPATCPVSAPEATGIYRVDVATRTILDPCGRRFAAAGMNGAYTLFDFPYVFQGTDGGLFDVWLDDPLNGGHYPGGGFSSGSVWDPTSNARVVLPDRYYAINGSATPGVPAAADHWHQRFLRINLLARGEGGSPTVEETLSAVGPDVREGIGYGTVQMLEAHDLTGAGRVPTLAWNSPTPAASDDFSAVVRFMDGLVTEYAITGTGGSSPLDQGYVWFNPTNEPWGNTAVADGCPPADYFDTQTFWIERLRNHHRAENLIVIDLSEWGQDLWGLAHGCYDDWWQSLADHPSGDLTRNVVLSWHAYGARRPALGQAYSYATMDADLAAATARFPLLIGEYGQPVGQGVNYAGPWQWNVDAVTWLATDDDGPALIDKYGLPAAVWTATGDSGYGHSFKLLQGPEPATDDNLSTPFWDVESGNDLRLERLGRVHWDLAHRLWP